jgi:uncharacterized protein YigA (DUF484 family)
MTEPLEAGAIAQYLKDHPDFFEGHPDLLASITLPHRHGTRAVSLVERQVDVLRDKIRGLELKFAELVRNGRENEAIADKMQRWSRDLLRERDPRELPSRVTGGLAAAFDVPQVALRVWGLPDELAGLPCATPVEADVTALADSMRTPFCGKNADFQPARWLPGEGAQTGSIALLPLRVGAAPQAFGLLVLGSPDPGRFEAGMGTTFLERIAEVASASLSRLTV